MTLKYIFGDDEYEYTVPDSDILYYTTQFLAEDYGISIPAARDLIDDLDIQDRVNEFYRDDFATCFATDALESYKASKEDHNI